MTTLVDINLAISKASTIAVMKRGEYFSKRYNSLKAGMKDIANGRTTVQLHYQPEYTYKIIHSKLRFRLVTMLAHRITISL